jgi:hypothetical protein
VALSDSQTAGTTGGGVDLSQPGGWAQATLVGLGAPHDPNTPQGRANITFLEAWRKAEGTAARYNPLATTLRSTGSTDFNSVGVQNYATPNDGIAATVATIRSGYPHIVAMLRAGDPGQLGSNTGVIADLNRWVSGRSSTTPSTYTKNIARIFFGEKGAADWTSFDLGDAGNAAADAAGKLVPSGIKELAAAVTSFVNAVLNVNTWRRVGLALLGLALMVIGGTMLARGSWGAGAGVAPFVRAA